MTHWRPPAQIRFKAIGLHWRAGLLLAAEVRDDSGRIKGVRPLGGTVEFGETAEAALIREFREELGITVTPLGPPVFFENIFVHGGVPGHEVIAAFDVDLPSGAFVGQTRITFREHDGTECTARWFDPATLDHPCGPALYPTGLQAYLRSR
ncbi:NUDIX hydrolase [Palleronia caenipelagi]|uniref:NUDIX domain-containing protein n=1 Tax=Palleronia caenipelagi TaxID=2489174 RepID=A0A547PN64_9RHOB|nr:NUDIX domain-containing protein [Palleronia caenipelagi]TRD15587.1 NUDIX domain-containing protein [Palleronia caenipelagi]